MRSLGAPYYLVRVKILLGFVAVIICGYKCPRIGRIVKQSSVFSYCRQLGMELGKRKILTMQVFESFVFVTYRYLQ